MLARIREIPGSETKDSLLITATAVAKVWAFSCCFLKHNFSRVMLRRPDDVQTQMGMHYGWGALSSRTWTFYNGQEAHSFFIPERHAMPLAQGCEPVRSSCWKQIPFLPSKTVNKHPWKHGLRWGGWEVVIALHKGDGGTQKIHGKLSFNGQVSVHANVIVHQFRRSKTPNKPFLVWKCFFFFFFGLCLVFLAKFLIWYLRTALRSKLQVICFLATPMAREMSPARGRTPPQPWHLQILNLLCHGKLFLF